MKYAQHRSTLRVTSPKGAQRRTYWHQLPYTYSILLLVLFSLLSWLASQSLFVVQIDILDSGRDTSKISSISSCDYSPKAIIVTVVIASMIVLGALIIAVRRHPPGMPLAAACSATISVACHPPLGDIVAAVQSVQ